MTRRPAAGADGAHGTQRDPCQHWRRCTHPQAARDEHPGPPGLIRAGARLRRLRAAGDPAPGTHPYGNAPESTAKKPPTGTSGAEEPGTSPTPPAPSGRTPVLATPGHRDSLHRQTIRRGSAPSGETCSLARDGWSAWCFSDWGSFSSRESIGWRPCQQRNTPTSSRPKWCVR